MAMYQVPQFLDSGDKIVFGMTVWQLLYAMAGFLLSLGMFSLVSNALPFLGIWSFIPVIPVAGLSLFLALGKYNGRDSDIYVLKFILMLAKPRKMVYQRQPDNYDLDEKLSKLTFQNIEKELQSRLQVSLADQANPLTDFNKVQSERKAEIIRQMGSNLDNTLYNTLQSVSIKQLEVEAKRDFLQNLEKQTPHQKTGWSKFFQANDLPKQTDNNNNQNSNQQTFVSDFQPSKIHDYISGGDMNFFDLSKDENEKKE